MDIQLADKYTMGKLPLDLVLQLDQYLKLLGSSLLEFEEWRKINESIEY